MAWIYLAEADPNRVRRLVPIGWEGTVRTEDGTERDATCEYDRGVVFRGADGEPIDGVVACEVGGSRSGPSLTEEQRARNGQGSLKLRLPIEVLGMLDWLHERRGDSRTSIIEHYIRNDYKEQRAIDAQRTK